MTRERDQFHRIRRLFSRGHWAAAQTRRAEPARPRDLPPDPLKGFPTLPSLQGAGGGRLSIHRASSTKQAAVAPPAACVFLRRAGSWPILGNRTQLAPTIPEARPSAVHQHFSNSHRLHPENKEQTLELNLETTTNMKNTTKYHCHECGDFCVLSFDDGWLVCLNCCGISSTSAPPDSWDFPDVDAVELAMAWCSGSITEHAHEH